MHLHRQKKAFTKYFALQSMHKAHPSTTLYYKACTRHFPKLLCTTKLAQSTFQYYFVLQSLHKHFPVLLCTTKLAQSAPQYYFVLQKLAQGTSQYYFVLPSLRKVLFSTTLYYKACTKHFPVLLCTAKLAHSMSL